MPLFQNILAGGGGAGAPAVNCAWLTPQQRIEVSEHRGEISEATTTITRLANAYWGQYGSRGTVNQGDADRLWAQLTRVADLVNPANTACVEQSYVNSLRQAYVRGYLAYYGRDPQGWRDVWSEVWPSVNPDGSSVMRTFAVDQAALARVGKRAAVATRVEADLAAVDALVRGATAALEQKDAAWARANLPAVRKILVDASGTVNVNPARTGRPAPAGVSAERWNLLKLAAQALYDLVPRLEELASVKPPVMRFGGASTLGRLKAWAFGPGGAGSQSQPGGPAQPGTQWGPLIVSMPAGIAPQAAPGEGLLDQAYAWVKLHPVLSLGLAAGAGYLAWQQWGTKKGERRAEHD